MSSSRFAGGGFKFLLASDALEHLPELRRHTVL